MSAPAIPVPVDGDQNRGPALLAIMWTEMGIATFVLALRVFVKSRSRGFGWEDYTMIACWALWVTDMGMATVAVNYGIGRHMYYLPPAQLGEVVKWNWINQAPGIVALGFTKVSISLLLLKLLGPNSVWRKRILWFIIVTFMTASCLSAIITYVQCDPPRALWEVVPGSTCWSPSVQADYATFHSSYSTFLDFFLALLPITIIAPLKLSVEKKVGLCFLLGLGLLSGVCAAIKTSQARELGVRSDLTWDVFGLYAYSFSEVFLNIICGSMPTLRPLYERVFNGIPFEVVRGRSYGGGRSGGGSASNARRTNMYANTNRSGRNGFMSYGRGKDGSDIEASHDDHEMSLRRGIKVDHTYEVETVSRASSGVATSPHAAV